MDLNNDGFFVEFKDASGLTIGKFTFEEGLCEFSGATDDCAKQFVEEVKRLWLLQTPKS